MSPKPGPLLLAVALASAACGGAKQSAAPAPPPATAEPAPEPAAPEPAAPEPAPPEPAPPEPAPTTDVVGDLHVSMRAATRACGAANAADLTAIQHCVCEQLAGHRFAASAGAVTLSWPLPTTPSGSTTTDSGDVRLVPLGPVFTISIDASGVVTRCGVTGPPPR